MRLTFETVHTRGSVYTYCVYIYWIYRNVTKLPIIYILYIHILYIHSVYTYWIHRNVTEVPRLAAHYTSIHTFWMYMNVTELLSHFYMHSRLLERCTTLQHTATHCNTLQHTTTHCQTLQRIAREICTRTTYGHRIRFIHTPRHSCAYMRFKDYSSNLSES